MRGRARRGRKSAAAGKSAVPAAAEAEEERASEDQIAALEEPTEIDNADDEATQAEAEGKFFYLFLFKVEKSNMKNHKLTRTQLHTFFLTVHKYRHKFLS